MAVNRAERLANAA